MGDRAQVEDAVTALEARRAAELCNTAQRMWSQLCAVCCNAHMTAPPPLDLPCDEDTNATAIQVSAPRYPHNCIFCGLSCL